MVILRHTPRAMGFKETFMASRAAIAWSVFMALPFMLVGYSQSLMVYFLAFEPFVQNYWTDLEAPLKASSDPSPEPGFALRWMVGLQLCVVGSSMIGALLAGWLSGWYSPRKLMASALAAFLACSIINFLVPPHKEYDQDMKGSQFFYVFLVGASLQGIPLGMIGTIAMNYVADICPRTIADLLLAYISMCWVLGMVTAAAILWAMKAMTIEVALTPEQALILVRFALGLQWLIPVIVIAGCYFAPESPWWLVREGRHAEAAHALLKLRIPNVPQRLAEYQALFQTETQMHLQNTYLDCFRGSNRRRTEIAVMTWLGQLLVGFVIVAQAVFLLHFLGLKSVQVLMMIFVIGCVALAGQLAYFALHAVFTFRALYIGGLCLICPILLSIGIVEALAMKGVLRPEDPKTVMWIQAGLLFGWSFVYGATLGPATPAIVCDTSASTLRPKTIALSRSSYDFANLIQTAIGPIMVHPQYANMRGLVAFPAAGFTMIWLVWSLLRLPEMEGIDPEIVDFLFEKQVPSPQFSQQASRVTLGLELTAGPHAGLRRPLPGDENAGARPAALVVPVPEYPLAPEVMEIHPYSLPSLFT